MAAISTHYVTFSKKYRPSSFEELRAQDVFVKILSYSILNDRLNQSYLLTGIRGVGKTTSARIIAKTINCTNSIIINEDTIKPCNTCPNCQSFQENNHPDILEIDAASKTSVDDIRVIIKSSEYRPLLGKYKIFIIDEIHMLSTSAFNALLKVLEEPPPHVIFIFATTEVQKIPLTVISRCQRFDLRRFTIKEVFDLIKQIVTKEKLEFDDETLKIIAYKSEGSARDALSLLDQAASLSFSNKQSISKELLQQLLGSVSLNSTIQFLKYIITKDANNSVKLVNDIYQAGGNLELFITSVSSLIAYFNKSKILTKYREDFYQLYQNEIEDILAIVPIEMLSILWQIFTQGIEEMKNFYNQLIFVEMLVLKSIYAQNFMMHEDIIDSVDITQSPDEMQSCGKVDNIKSLDYIKSTIIQENITHTLPNLTLEFLKYLYNAKEMELYYLLLNETEIITFGPTTLHIGTTNDTSHKYKESLEKILFSWNKQSWTVIIQKKIYIIPLRQVIIDTMKDSKEWDKIKQHFPSANISDILCLN